MREIKLINIDWSAICDEFALCNCKSSNNMSQEIIACDRNKKLHAEHGRRAQSHLYVETFENLGHGTFLVPVSGSNGQRPCISCFQLRIIARSMPEVPECVADQCHAGRTSRDRQSPRTCTTDSL